VKLLLAHGANPTDKDPSGWTALDEAVEKQNEPIVRMLFNALYEHRIRTWEQTKLIAAQGLVNLPDFHLEINWEFTSNYIPFIR
jgi:ankyrin repeat protein